MMRFKHVLALAAAVLLAATISGSLAAEDEASEVKLFADDSLTGWVEEQHHFYKKKHPKTSTWSVEDGVVRCDGSTGNCGFLRYETKLSDFRFTCEYQVSRGCNSGVGFRAAVPYTTLSPNTLPSNVGYEFQIQDDAGSEPTKQGTGAFYNVQAPKANAARPAGEWNQLAIECRGPQIRVTLNGTVVQDVDQRKLPGQPRPLAGFLSLQNHGHDVAFRKLRLTVLPADSTDP